LTQTRPGKITNHNTTVAPYPRHSSVNKLKF
jgi:hypothetical protein